MNYEQWKDYPEYEEFYRVSNLGRILRKERQRVTKTGRVTIVPTMILKPTLDTSKRNGYLKLRLNLNGKKINLKPHRAVCIAFNGEKPFPKAEINHKDGNKRNNTADNLEWLTHSENAKHGWIIGLNKMTEERKLKCANAAKVQKQLRGCHGKFISILETHEVLPQILQFPNQQNQGFLTLTYFLR